VAISISSLTRGGQVKPPRILAYATHGIGKTSLAAGAPNPVFLQTEDGLGMLDAPTFGILKSYDELMSAIGELYSQPHDFQTAVIDTLDWAEPLIWSEACRVGGWPNIEAAGFGKGYVAATDIWRCVLDGLNALRDERGMAVILLAHAEIKRLELPDIDPFDRYQPKLHRSASAAVQEHMDAVFFLNYRVSLVRTDPKDKNSKQRGVGGGQRLLYTTERPSHLAKNRWRMSDVISLPDDPDAMWPEVSSHIPYYAANVTTLKDAA
jgi:hypothetical protein